MIKSAEQIYNEVGCNSKREILEAMEIFASQNEIEYTELKFYPNNKVKIVEVGTIKGSHNQVVPIMALNFKNLDRKKESYIYRVKINSAISYKYNLKSSEFETYKIYITDL